MNLDVVMQRSGMKLRLYQADLSSGVTELLLAKLFYNIKVKNVYLLCISLNPVLREPCASFKSLTRLMKLAPVLCPLKGPLLSHPIVLRDVAKNMY